MIALPAPYGSGKARAKGADQQGDKGPQQGVRDRFASSFRCRLGTCERVRNPLISVGLARACFCHHHLIEVTFIGSVKFAVLQSKGEDSCCFAARRSGLRLWLRAIPTEKGGGKENGRL
jgi:hypothetical protein